MPLSLTTLLQHAVAQGSRSTALKPLAWLVAISFVSAVAAFQVSAPAWVGTSFAITGLISSGLYLVAYIFFAIKDRDALRSERFSIQKMAIERGLIGDDLVGMRQPTELGDEDELLNAKSINGPVTRELKEGR